MLERRPLPHLQPQRVFFNYPNLQFEFNNTSTINRVSLPIFPLLSTMARYPYVVNLAVPWSNRVNRAKSPAKPFRFLDLPKDIRFVFYDVFFEGSQITLKKHRSQLIQDDIFDIYLGHPDGPQADPTTLTLTCKTIYAETRLHFIRSTRFFVPGVNVWSGSLFVAMNRSLSNFTLGNLRYLDGLPFTGSDSVFEPNPALGPILKLLPALRVCASKVVSIQLPFSESKFKQCLSDGPAYVFHDLGGGRTAQQFLSQCGVNTSTGPEYIMSLVMSYRTLRVTTKGKKIWFWENMVCETFTPEQHAVVTQLSGTISALLVY